MKKFHVVLIGIVLLSLKTAAQYQSNHKAYFFENLPVVKATEFKTDTLNIVNFGDIKGFSQMRNQSPIWANNEVKPLINIHYAKDILFKNLDYTKAVLPFNISGGKQQQNKYGWC